MALAVGPALLVAAMWRVPDPERLVQICKAALGWELVLALALNFVAVALKVRRWQLSLGTCAIAYPFREAWNAYNAATYVGLLTPGRIGDVLRVAYLTRDRGASKTVGLSSVVVDRLFDLSVLGAFATAGALHLGSKLGAANDGVVWWSIALALAAVPLFLLLASSRRVFTWVSRRLSKQADSGVAAEFFELAQKQLKGVAVSATVLTVLSFSVVYLQAALLARALGLSLGLFDVVALNALSTLFALLPVSVSGLGVREVLFATLFPTLGHSATAGVGYGLLVFSVMYLAMVGYGFVVWQRHPLGGPSLPRGLR